MLDELRRKAYQWFLDNRNPETGIVSDSTAQTGYHLTILPSLSDDGYVHHSAARQQAERTLSHALHDAEHHLGILSGASLIDMSIFLNGCIVIARDFPSLSPLVDKLLARVQWDKFLVEVEPHKKFLGQDGSPPLSVCSCENLMPYFLGAASGAISGLVWYNTTVSRYYYNGQMILNCDLPLSTATVGLIWLDLKEVWDNRYTDFYKDARAAEKVMAEETGYGPTLAADINRRNRRITTLYMSHPVVKTGMAQIGFKRKDAPYHRGERTVFPSGD